MDLIRSRLDPEPHGVERGKEEQDRHRADRRAADQRMGHRSPEDGVREGTKASTAAVSTVVCFGTAV
jgi:hypothetical protein